MGLAILILAIGLGMLLYTTSQRAQSRDHKDSRSGIVMGDFPLCAWEANLPQRVLSENSSQTIVINATNSADTDCQSALSLLAPGFDVSPRKEQQTVTVKPKGQGSIAWIVIPQKSGSFDIAVSDGIDTRVIGVTVTNVFGLTATQAQFFSVLGTLLGPMFTVPWWLDRWQKRKRAIAPTAVDKTGGVAS